MSSYIRLNENGIIEQIDLHTGESRLILEEHQSNLVAEGGLIRITAEDGSTAWVSRTITFAEMRKIAGDRKFYPYSTLLAEDICAKVAEGAELIELCHKNGLPGYATICSWKRENPEFDQMYRQALRDKAAFFFARARAEVERASIEDDVPIAKLRSDFYKYGAKVSDPSSFQEVQKVDARVAIGVTKLETGIRRVSDSGFDKGRIDQIEKQFNLRGRDEERNVGDDNRHGSEGVYLDVESADDRREPLGVGGDVVVDGGGVRDGGGASGSGPDSVL